MIELTDEQIQSLSALSEAPPRAVNPKTNETFVLLRVEEYERLKAEDDELDYSPWTREELEGAAAAIADATDWITLDDEPADPQTPETP